MGVFIAAIDISTAIMEPLHCAGKYVEIRRSRVFAKRVYSRNYMTWIVTVTSISYPRPHLDALSSGSDKSPTKWHIASASIDTKAFFKSFSSATLPFVSVRISS